MLGPWFHKWFSFLDRIVTGSGNKAAFIKLAIDQGKIHSYYL